MSDQITMKQISEMSGVSIATVSRIINNNGRFSKETEKRVRAIIDKYNYTPNILGKGLRTKKTSTIGIVVPDITNEFFAKIVQEIEKNLFKLSYTAFVCNTNESYEIEKRYVSTLKLHSVSGLIYISGDTRQKHEYIEEIPSVYIDRWPSTTKSDIVFIESDNFDGGRKATLELLDKGCKKIVFLTDERRTSSQQSRFEGYIRAHREYGIVPDEDFIIGLSKINFETAYNAITDLINKGIQFDGIFASTDWLALGAKVALDNAEIKVPEEVKIVGFDNISISKYSSTPITTINQNVCEMAHTAVEVLMRLINEEEVDKRYYVIPVDLIRRETT